MRTRFQINFYTSQNLPDYALGTVLNHGTVAHARVQECVRNTDMTT